MILPFLSSASSLPSEYASEVEGERWVAASVKIRRLLKGAGVSELERIVYVSDLTMVERRKGDAGEGLKVLGAELPAELQRRARPQLEKGLCLQALKRWDDAMSVLRPLTGVEENRIRLPAGLAVAQVAMELRQYQQAIDACQQVIRDGRGESLIGDLATVRAARALLEVATDAFALATLGEDYQKYRQARVAQAAGKYAEAIDLYDRIRQNPVLLDAARCYAAECYYLLGEDRKGERIYREFVADNLFGLYRGEARLQWARFILLRKPGASALQEARKQLEEASEWFELVVAKKPPIEVGDVQVMVKYFPAPDAYTRPGDLGGLVRSYAGPATILNRLTARWYVPMHHVHALLLLGYTCFELEDYEGAAAAIEKAVSLNQAYGGAFLGNEAARNQLHAALAARSFLVPPKVWKSPRRDHERALRLACFYTVAGEYDSARALFTEVLRRDKRDPLRDGELAIANYGLARCCFGKRQMDEAVKQLEPFMGTLRRDRLAEPASMLLAHLLAGEPDGFERARDLYLQVARRGSTPELRADALLALAVMATNRGDNALAVKSCAALLKQYPESIQAPAARTLANRLYVASGVVRDGLPPADPPEITTGAGRVAPINVHLILPGANKLRSNAEQLQAADLMRYQVTASPQSDCIIVRGFSMNFTPYEPRIVPAIGRQAQFIRAPVLFRDTIWGSAEREPTRYAVSESGELLFWDGQLTALLAKKDFRGAERLLRQHLENPQTNEGYLPLLRADLARVYRLGGAPEKGAKLIDELDFSVQSQRRIRLERGLIALAMNDTKKAGELLARAKEANNPEIRAVATWHLADLAYREQQYERAGKLAAEVVQLARQAHLPEIAAMLAPARELVEATRRDEIVGAHGESYWQYRQGRIAQAAGRHADAIAAYDKVVDHPILQEAAALYRAMALAASGRTRDGRRAFEHYLATWPNGFYTGEALLEWARMEYLAASGDDAVRQARQHLDAAVAWMERFSATRRDLAPVAGIVAAWPSGDRMSRPGRPGWPGPGCIVNPATTLWYMDYLELRIHFLRGFLASEVSQTAEARAAFGAAGDVIERLGFSPAGVRLRVDQALASDAWLIPARRWRLLDRDVRRPLRLACFYYVSGQEWMAQPLFEELLKRDGLGREEEAVARYGLAVCLLRQDQRAKAAALLKPFEEALQRTDMLDYVRLLQELQL